MSSRSKKDGEDGLEFEQPVRTIAIPPQLGSVARRKSDAKFLCAQNVCCHLRQGWLGCCRVCVAKVKVN